MTTYCDYIVWNLTPREKMKVTFCSDYAWFGENWQRREKVVNAPAQRTLGVSFRQTSMDERRALRDFFDARRGSLTPFWFPSFKHDLTLAADAVSGAETIRIEGNGEEMGLYNLARHVYAPEGGMRFKISNPEKRGDGSVALTVSPALPAALAAGCEFQWLFPRSFRRRRIEDRYCRFQ